jgi:hypothetical protein
MATITVLAYNDSGECHTVGTFNYEEDLSQGVYNYTQSTKFNEGFNQISFKDEYDCTRSGSKVYDHLPKKYQPAFA